MARMLKMKIAVYLKARGTQGAKRTMLLRRYACSAEELDRALPALVAEGVIVEWVRTTRGRPSTIYYDKIAVADLTPPQDQVMPVTPEPGTPPHRSTFCKVCGVAISWPENGRPYVYCSRACRQAAREGGVTLKEFMARARDPRVFVEAVICLVILDLTVRGFDVARHLFITGPRLLVTDRNGGLGYLDVVPIGTDGRFPNPQEYETMAGVYLDGRITYAGRNCFIENEPALPGEEGEQLGEGVVDATPVLGIPEAESAAEAELDRLNDPDEHPDPWAASDFVEEDRDPDEGDR